MSAQILDRMMGKGNALFSSDGYGSKRLFKVLEALALEGISILSAAVASPSAAVLASAVVPRDGKLGKFVVRIATCGTADSNVLVVNLNGTVVAGSTITIAHDATDGTAVEVDLLALDVDIEVGDLIEVEATAVATGVAGLTAVVTGNNVYVG